MTFKVVHTHYQPGFPVDDTPLREIGVEMIKTLCRTDEEIVASAHDADGIIVGATYQPIRRSVIEKLAKCRVIANMGVGYEGIDIEAATEKGICVAYTPDYCVEEVSDHTMALLLACARKVLITDRSGKKTILTTIHPEGRKLLPPMFRLRGQTLGLLGFGRISRLMVPKARGFGLRIIAYDPYITKKAATELGVELVGLDNLLQESDYVSVHAALTPETKHMLGVEQFKKMKRTAYLINTARGGLVDEKALYTALTQGYIAGAATDVMDPEPPDVNNPLLKLDNFIFTGHSARYSEQSEVEFWRQPSEEVARVLKGEWPHGFVNPQVKDIFLNKWKKQ